MLFLKSDFASYESINNELKKEKDIENFSNTYFGSIKDFQEKSNALFDTSHLEKKNLSGTYSIDQNSMPIAGLKFIISKMGENVDIKKFEERLSKDSGNNVMSAFGLRALSLLKNQEALLLKMTDHFSERFKVSAQGSNFSIEFNLVIFDFLKDVFGIDVTDEKFIEDNIPEEQRASFEKYYSRNPNFLIILSGSEIKSSKNDNPSNRENLYSFNNFKLDIDFPDVISPILFSSFVDKEDESKAYLSGIGFMDNDSLVRKSGKSISVLKLNRTGIANLNIIIGIALVVLFLLVIFTLLR